MGRSTPLGSKLSGAVVLFNYFLTVLTDNAPRLTNEVRSLRSSTCMKINSLWLFNESLIINLWFSNLCHISDGSTKLGGKFRSKFVLMVRKEELLSENSIVST